VLDCCFAGGAANKANVLSLNQRKLDQVAPIDESPFGGRLLLGCQSYQTAYQAEFLGEYHGTFTWALTSALLQWAVVQQGSSQRLDLSYGEARDRARKLLGALSYPQQPDLAPRGPAPDGVEDLALFQTGSGLQFTSPDPDGQQFSIQIDGGGKGFVMYTLDYSVSSMTVSTGHVLATNTSRFPFGPQAEYWHLTSEIVTSSRGTLKFTPNEQDWGMLPPAPPFTTGKHVGNSPEMVTWTCKGATGPSGNLFSGTRKLITAPDQCWVAISFTPVDSTHLMAGQYGGSIDWWWCLPSTLDAKTFVSSELPITSKSSITLTYGGPPSPPSGYQWWYANVSLTDVTLP
jgi:hypothetical protein